MNQKRKRSHLVLLLKPYTNNWKTRGPKCHNRAPDYLFWNWTHADNDLPEKQTWWRMLSIWHLPPFKFRWIPFSGCREKLEKVSANRRLKWLTWFSEWPEKHKLCRVSLNSVQWLQRRNHKCEKTDGRRKMCNYNSAPVKKWQHKIVIKEIDQTTKSDTYVLST